ncbi:MAG: flagellar biosynthetic protein FliR [Novosphingobium sp.]|uniref:flagellar biosynthetic protein FliR n=1 Tax=Novosphingobium sp. TaxID=1874826 RepID=UPI0032BC3C16
MNTLTFGFGAIEADLWRLLFVMTRIGAALLAAPFFSAGAVPVQLRVAIAGAIGVLVIAWLPVQVPPALLSASGILILLSEVLIGLTLGFVLQLTFAAPILAAEQIGGAMGMSIATASDPVSGAHSPALGQYFTVLLTVVFLGLGGHLTWLKLVIESFTAFPPGAAWLSAEQLQSVALFGSDMFIAAVAIALPVTLVLLLVQMVAGVLSRSAPSLNLFSLGLPAGVLAGIAALIAAAPLLADQFADLSAQGIEQAASLLMR